MNKSQEEKLREEYINAHRHDWEMHQEADWWLSKFQELLNEKAEAVGKLKEDEISVQKRNIVEPTRTHWANVGFKKAIQEAVDIIKGNKE